MKWPARSAAALLCLASIFAVGGSALAQSAPGEDPASLREAKELFRKGVTLFVAGDIERALDLFRSSRETLPSKQNTINVAICLDRLQRWDEALEVYEDVITNYGNELTEEEKGSIPGIVSRLRAHVGSADIVSNVSGAVIVDGRERAKVPLRSPVRLLPGNHDLRVIKDGYKSFEARISISAGQLTRIDAHLEPLAAAGGLRVEDPTLPGADVVVDGVTVGKAPWEGTLAPGQHIVASRKEALGSAPTVAQVLQGQTALLRLHSSKLGTSTRLSVTPPTGHLSINGAPVARGNWEGSLPLGQYTIHAEEEGYFPKDTSITVSDGDTPRTILVLAVDPNHPKWPKPPKSHILISANAGFGLSHGFHSGPEGACTTNCEEGLAYGLLASVRAGYELSFGLSFELLGGYLDAHREVSRELTSAFGTHDAYTAHFHLNDSLRLRNFFVGPGLGYRHRLTGDWQLAYHGAVGAIIISARDEIGVSTSAGGTVESASVIGSGNTVTSTRLFAAFDLLVERTFGAWHVGAGLGLFAVPSGYGPSLGNGEVYTNRTLTNCGDANPGAAGCAGGSGVVQGERAYGPLLFLVPELTIGWQL